MENAFAEREVLYEEGRFLCSFDLEDQIFFYFVVLIVFFEETGWQLIFNIAVGVMERRELLIDFLHFSVEDTIQFDGSTEG